MRVVFCVEETGITIQRNLDMVPLVGEFIDAATLYNEYTEEDSKDYLTCTHIIKERKVRLYDDPDNVEYVLILKPCFNDREVFPFEKWGNEKTTTCSLRTFYKDAQEQIMYD